MLAIAGKMAEMFWGNPWVKFKFFQINFLKLNFFLNPFFLNSNFSYKVVLKLQDERRALQLVSN